MIQVEEQEAYEVGNGDLKLKSYLGNGHSGSIEVKMNDEFIVRKINEEVNENLDEKTGALKVVALSNKNSDNNGILTIELRDDENTETYMFSQEFDSDGIMSFEITIEVSR